MSLLETMELDVDDDSALRRISQLAFTPDGDNLVVVWKNETATYLTVREWPSFTVVNTFETDQEASAKQKQCDYSDRL